VTFSTTDGTKKKRKKGGLSRRTAEVGRGKKGRYISRKGEKKERKKAIPIGERGE